MSYTLLPPLIPGLVVHPNLVSHNTPGRQRRESSKQMPSDGLFSRQTHRRDICPGVCGSTCIMGTQQGPPG